MTLVFDLVNLTMDGNGNALTATMGRTAGTLRASFTRGQHAIVAGAEYENNHVTRTADTFGNGYVVRDSANYYTEVFDTLDGTVHAACGVVKMHTEAFGAFCSPRGGPLGDVDGGSQRLAPRPRRGPVAAQGVEGRVALIAAAAGIDGAPVRRALQDGAKGIVLEALGRGNVPPAMLSAVAEATAAGVPVVVASRCPRGSTGPTYAYPGGGRTLQDVGAVFAGDLSAVQARVRLMVLLGAGAGRAEVQESFAR